jgi:hypothetical protein
VLSDWKQNGMRRSCGLALLTLAQKTLDLNAMDFSLLADGEEWIDELYVKWQVTEDAEHGGVKVINLRVMLSDYVLADSIVTRSPLDPPDLIQ